MARSEGLALAPWGVLGSGKIRTNAEEARRREWREETHNLESQLGAYACAEESV
jgi:hypothetical protein